MAVLPVEQRARAEELDPEEARAIFDQLARQELSISGAEFIRRWDAGEYRGKADQPHVARVAMILPFGR